MHRIIASLSNLFGNWSVTSVPRSLHANSLAIFTLSLIVFPVELLACPDSTPSQPKKSASLVQVISASQPQRPSFNASELKKLKISTQELSDTWVGMSSIGKMVDPPVVSTELQAFRRQWQAKNPIVAPFLGTWTYNEMFKDARSLIIFPATNLNQVCILEYEAEVQATPEDILSPKGLMVYPGTVVGKELRSSRLRSDRSVIVLHPLGAGRWEFMGADLKDDRSGAFAASTPPKFPENFPREAATATQEVLAQQGCQVP